MDNRRQDRHPLTIQGRYRTGRGIARDVVIKDLSLTGCRMFDRFSTLETGRYISIRIGSIGPISARVRWREGNVAGLQFEDPLHESVLTHMCTTIEGWTEA